MFLNFSSFSDICLFVAFNFVLGSNDKWGFVVVGIEKTHRFGPDISPEDGNLPESDVFRKQYLSFGMYVKNWQNSVNSHSC